MDQPQLSADQVRKVAMLSRLALTDDQVETYRVQLSAVLDYMERLKEVDIQGVEPLVHVGDQVNRLDEDVPGNTLPRESLMRMAPDAMPPFLRVPKVIEGEGA
jgi:aspartyl-tRNA(Asn)/glutamyl-tRNA(Gln) amidotransferase subunit C